jgi:hypothetical protein
MNNAKISGILQIISGVFGLIYTFSGILVAYLRGFFSASESSYLSSELYPIVFFFLFFFLIMSSMAVIGGLFALRKQHWGWAFTGAIFSVMMLFPCGIPALILIIQAKSEFGGNLATL